MTIAEAAPVRSTIATRRSAMSGLPRMTAEADEAAAEEDGRDDQAEEKCLALTDAR